jgi:AcrR family transcriptional regulator
MATLDELPLRQRKFATTKLSLLRAAVERLDARSLDELRVRELCDAVGISEASFFNYFPRKTDLLLYFVQIWTVDVAWHVLREKPAPSSVNAAIRRIFDVTAAQATDHPRVMAEVLAVQARLTTQPSMQPLTLAERLSAFPGRQGIEDVPEHGLDSLLPDLLRRAVRQGELPQRTDLRAATLGLTAIFFGVPIVMRRIDPSAIARTYRSQLEIYWAGLSAIPRRSRPTKRRRSAR